MFLCLVIWPDSVYICVTEQIFIKFSGLIQMLCNVISTLCTCSVKCFPPNIMFHWSQIHISLFRPSAQHCFCFPISEPVLFLSSLGWSVIFGAEVATNLLMLKVCHYELNYPLEICSNLSAGKKGGCLNNQIFNSQACISQAFKIAPILSS